MKIAKKPKKKTERKFTMNEMVEYAKAVNQEVERNVITTMLKCGYSAMIYNLCNPPFNFTKAKAEKFKRYFDRSFVSAYKEEKADWYIEELNREIGFDMLNTIEFDMFDLGRYHGPDSMKKFFGKGWDDELTDDQKKKVKKAWGNYKIKRSK